MRDLLNIPAYRQGQAVRNLEDVERGTFRRRADEAVRQHYIAQVIEPGEWFDDYVAINRSKQERQGRTMADHYWNPKPTGVVGRPKCDRHHTLCYGVLHDSHLVAYSTVHRVGDLVMLSMILGHGDHLTRGIMYLLTRYIAAHQLALGGPGILYYNRWDSGTDGLRFFKERIGMYEEDVTWTATT